MLRCVFEHTFFRIWWLYSWSFNYSAMIEYAKVILPKVSFSKFLFRKELLKCIGWMKSEERDELQQWCFKTFHAEFADVLEEVFQSQAA